MRPAVHPDGAGLLIRADVLLDRDDLLRLRVLFIPDPQVQWAAIDIRRDMHLALMLRKCEPRGVPAFRPEASSVSDGEPGVIHELRARSSFGLILHEPGCPISRKVQSAGRRERP